MHLMNLKNIQLSNNSELKIIKNNAFSYSSIESIIIPSEVTYIGKYAFSYKQFRHIELPKNSKLQTIEEFAFINSSIDSIRIPSEVTKIGKKAFFRCWGLRNIKFSKKSK